MKPLIEITDKKILSLLDRMEGIESAKKSIEALNVPLPGVKLALAAIESVFQTDRCILHAKVFRLAAMNGADVVNWVPSGVRCEKEKVFIDFAAASEL